MASFLERLRTLDPQLDWGRLPPDAEARLEAFATAAPLYARAIESHPRRALWLEEEENLRTHHGFHALLANWNAMRAAHDSPQRESPRHPELLRRFRRKMSMRIAYRDVANVASTAEIVEELTRLAEFCLREVLFVARSLWNRRLGEPWNEATDQPALFCVLGLGKLGGQELNFSSDIDLVFLYEGDGCTRRGSRLSQTSNAEYFQRLGETISQLLNARDGAGFLFRADLRLRPGGAAAPLVPAMEAVENYYAATGQTWERLALIKARPVAGDLALGAELLENLHSFRYPRHPPPSLAAEIAAMKQRTEREIVGAAALERDVKSGFGGIREIEFFTQAMQLLHAGRFPFLQTHSTIAALEQLVRYGLLEAATGSFLEETYWLLRRIEHRVQMADEQQTHELPAEDSEREAIGRSLGFADLASFDRDLRSRRERVRAVYSTLFRNAGTGSNDLLEEWWSFFAAGKESPGVRERLARWFNDAEGAADGLRRFVHESATQPLMREQARHFTDLLPQLDRTFARLARPIDTLGRISSFGDRYATRAQFLAACAMNRDLLPVLALLFDRSRFIHELLCQHPEIFEEVFRPEILRKQKDLAARLRELAGHPGEPLEEHRAWLWLYVRAEQVRAAIGHLLGLLDPASAARELSSLAESVVLDLLRRVPGGEELLVVALGKLGGGELAFGSDLDLVFLAADDRAATAERALRSIQKRLAACDARDAVFQLDLRLRPHGDAGPLVAGIEAADSYYENTAQLWERQTLTRARVLAGPAALREKWQALIAARLRARSLRQEEADELWRMRLRVERERDRIEPPERAFKTGAGGLIDIEFSLQILQLAHGHAVPQILTPDTRLGWTQAGRTGIVPERTAETLLAHHEHLKAIEFALRRDSNRAETRIPADASAQNALAVWLGARDWSGFWQEHRERMRETRTLVTGALAGVVASTALEGLR